MLKILSKYICGFENLNNKRNKGKQQIIYNDDKGELTEGVGFDNQHFKRYLKQKAARKLKEQNVKVNIVQVKTSNKFKQVSDMKTVHDPENSTAKTNLKKKAWISNKKETSTSANVDKHVYQTQKVVLEV